MPRACDFAVEWQGDTRTTTDEIFCHLLLNRIKANMPCVILVSGRSGRGKSSAVLNVAETLFAAQNLTFADHVINCVIFNPFEYAEKVKAILTKPELKKVNVIIIDEARAVVGSDQWHSFVNQTIAHINATSRSIKPLIVFIVTQSIRDIDPNTRYTLDFHWECMRYWNSPVFVKPFTFWEDLRDIDRPKLRRRKVQGLINKNGENIKVFFKWQSALPSKEVIEIYEQQMKSAKLDFIEKKIAALIDKLNKERDKFGFDRVAEVVSYFTSPDHSMELRNMAKVVRGKWRVDSEFGRRFNFSDEQVKEFEKRITAFGKEQNEEKTKAGGLID